MDNINSLNTKHVQSPQGTTPSAPPEGSRQTVSPVPADVSAARIEALVKDLNSALENVDGDYSVSVDSDTGMVIVRITDVETGEIVKQVPPQQVLDVSMSVEKIIGLLINDQG